MQLFEVRFEPDGLKVKVPHGTTIYEAANRAGIILNGICGGAGTCRKCMVQVDGQTEPVRSCQYPVEHDLVVTIPQASRFFEQKILQEGIVGDDHVDPYICKHYLRFEPPSLDDLRSDANRLIDAIAETDCPKRPATCQDNCGTASTHTSVAFPLLRQLPVLFRDHNFAVTAVCNGGRVFALEPGDTTETMHGVAVDVGTTTVVAQLVDLKTGQTVARASETNPQVAFGDDVVSRIGYSTSQPDGLAALHHRIIACLNKLIGQLCRQSLINPYQIYEVTAAGNATMQHLLLGIPVEQIAQAPYVSVVASGVNISAGDLGIEIHPQANVYVMPSVAAHIGGDTVAVGLATAMQHSEAINLAIDIGTNGELILGNKEQLLTCSTAAGPAFEGARIEFGMRGAAGAIEKVTINDDVDLAVIGQVKPTGICGSGLIDALAVLVDAGFIDATGRLLEPEELPSDTPENIKSRLLLREDGMCFVLAWGKETGHGKDIVLTQRDIREAQLGKAAIAAGVATLLNEMGITLDDVEHLYLAGAFGNYIDPASAKTIGLLPEIPLEKVMFVGNAASAGAKMVLLSQAGRAEAENFGQSSRYVELAGRLDFQSIYSECMFFGEL